MDAAEAYGNAGVIVAAAIAASAELEDDPHGEKLESLATTLDALQASSEEALTVARSEVISALYMVQESLEEEPLEDPLVLGNIQRAVGMALAAR